MATLANSATTTADKAKSAVNSGLNQIDTSAIMDSVEDYKEQAVEAYRASEKYIRQNPFYFIGGAAAIGLLSGLLLARRK